MRIVLFSLVAGLALANTPAPTIPTPYPTQTPAPESLCSYALNDNGPFALDCLQLEFTAAGCSMRGDSYPTNSRINANDKEWYNAQTWRDVKSEIQRIIAQGGVNCYGASTPVPTEEPTPNPTSLPPTPAPTRPPTDYTPAPTYGVEAIFQVIFASASTNPGTAADAAAACVAMGYNRQYDNSQYVIRIAMNGGVDFYTAGPGEEICDLIADPVNGGTLMWSDRAEGPFIPVTVVDASTFTVLSSTTGPQGRPLASWVSTQAGGGGYGAISPSTGVLTGAMNQPYTMSLTTQREFQACRERVSPLLVNTGDSPSFVSACSRSGNSGQVWDDTAPLCDGSDNMNFLYASANRQMGTCDSLCTWGLDYDGTEGSDEYWFWYVSNNCWKRTSEYFAGEFKFCQVDDPGFGATELANWQHAQDEKALLCRERCDLGSGWVYAMGSCYRVSIFSDYQNQPASGNSNKGIAECQANLSSGTALLASINSIQENTVAAQLCAVTNQCYFGGMTGFGNGSGAWADGKVVTYTNWATSEAYDRQQGNTMAMLEDGSWTFHWDNRAIGVLCETAADTDAAAGYKDVAEACALDDVVAADEIANTSSFPKLNVVASGFTDAANPDMLHIVIDIPKTMYNPSISFENSTNDAADYSWEWDNSLWTVTNDNTDCSAEYRMEGAIAWTVFNLGGAGGVERLATWEKQTLGNSQTTQDGLQSDGSGVYYQFGSTVRITATQPLFTEIRQTSAAGRIKRETRMDREITVRVPFILRFQKTVTVTTDVNIISTKYNYKTVAAIIQSIQHSTQYFQPPYAQIMMQIRTKSQYPYLLDTTIPAGLYVASTAGNPQTTVSLSLDHLADDGNCTFTNSDHMREGDICTQEWLLHIVPADNVCYATGEYSVEFTTGCFYGKDVCYRPVDGNGNDIDTVTFTFKLQTSKFCPVMADQVDLAGTLEITGRESFKPVLEGVEGPSAGQMYMQGETIHVFATTSSTKAKIIDTQVVMVELEQDLINLVQTGYNRVPYDPTFESKTIWMKDLGAGRVANGVVTVSTPNAVTRGIVIMEDAGVYGTGENPCSTHATPFDCTMGPNEAGFLFNLHSRAMPVNVDSFGTKKIRATLMVVYEALNGNSNGRRRRLMNQQPTFDMRSSVSFGTTAWSPHSMPKGMGTAASMSLSITLSSTVDRTNALSFSQAIHAAIVQSLNVEAVGSVVYDSQVAVDQIFSDDVSIWTRPAQGVVSSRRLLNVAQELRIDFTFSNVKKPNAMLLRNMIANFDKQLRNPASPLLNQPLFAGAVVHDVREIATSNYAPITGQNTALASSALMAGVPSLFALLALLW